MYSILPASVSLVFLGYGVFVLASRGFNRITLSFFLLCITTFFWQFTWSILFQAGDERVALVLAKLGYLLILILPTTLYHFVVELTRDRREQRWVLASYGAAGALAFALTFGDGVVGGVQRYFFGFYPSAGPLHRLHVLHTALVVWRALYLLFRAQRIALSTERLRLRYCLASLLIYCIAAVDYLANYGVEMYPPGVLFVAASLGIISQAMARHNLLANPMMLAATIAHEMRTPLATIGNQAGLLRLSLPQLIAGYEYAAAHGAVPRALGAGQVDYLRGLARHIEAEVARSNFIADMVLASAKSGDVCTDGFARHSVQACVEQALANYPFEPGMADKVIVGRREDFHFHGSDTLLIYVLYNLLKNATGAVRTARRGQIEIAYYADQGGNYLTVTDTALGIPQHVLPHVFDPFFTTRHAGGGSGMGLAFCRRVVAAFGGTILCRSREGEFTTVSVALPIVARLQPG